MKRNLGANPGGPGLKKVAVIGTHVPRRCGIATFSADLLEALRTQFEKEHFFAVAISDREESYAYPPSVQFDVFQQEVGSYRRAADFLNVGDVDVVSLQHEYGIFGGHAGRHVLAMLRELRMPIVTTLHTVLETPDAAQKAVLDEIVTLSERLIVMNGIAARIVADVHSVPRDQIDVIPHGIPATEFADPTRFKEIVGMAGRKVLLTFGLLSPDKGIEYAIDALPRIVERVPDALYAVVGVTHPHIQETSGESYRMSLRSRAERLGVSRHLVFHDRFVGLDELMNFLRATDVYVTPYLNMAQVSSGTLAYAVGTGTASIATPSWCAQELLADGRGILVEARNADAIADAALRLLENDDERDSIRKRGYEFGRSMTWPTIAERYYESFQRARQDHVGRLTRVFQIKPVGERPMELPEVRLAHLQRLTDDTGLIEHAVFDVPNYDEGYALDDNARGLMLCALLDQFELAEPEVVDELASRFMAFVLHAYHPLFGRFRNCMSFDRRWHEKIGSEDSHGRTLRALGTTIHRSSSTTHPTIAKKLFDMALPAVSGFTSPRAWAFTLLGIDEYLQRFLGESTIQAMREELTLRLKTAYEASSSANWRWFEDVLAYSNAKIPQAMIVSGQWMGRADLVEIGLDALEWLSEIQTSPTGQFSPIGSSGQFRKGKERPMFDQQPIEAYATVSASLAAFRLTGDEKWVRRSRAAFEWFLGNNDVGLALYEPSTGACRDGLQPDGVNENMGAESTLAFLLSLVEMHAAQDVLQGPKRTPSTEAAVR